MKLQERKKEKSRKGQRDEMERRMKKNTSVLMKVESDG